MNIKLRLAIDGEYKLRVMHVIYSFAVGGSECVARDIALNMNGNIRHSVVALEFDGPLRRILVGAGVDSFLIDRQGGKKIGSMLRLWRAMRKFKPDVVHSHHLHQLFYACPAALLVGARIVHTEHEFYSLMSEEARRTLRFLSFFCSAVTCVNEETSQFLIKKAFIPERKIRTVLNGVSIERFESGISIRKSLGLSEGDPVVGIIARLDPVKDHSMLIKAFRIVVDRMPRAKLLVVGDGSERLTLMSLVSANRLGGNVLFLGNRSDIPDLLFCLDVAALSSRKEGLPLSLLEAMAAGKPVVATEVGGVPSVVRDNSTGLLVRPGDAMSMASCLLRVLNDAPLGKRLGQHGRDLIRDSYSLERMLRAYESIYRTAVNWKCVESPVK